MLYGLFMFQKVISSTNLYLNSNQSDTSELPKSSFKSSFTPDSTLLGVSFALNFMKGNF